MRSITSLMEVVFRRIASLEIWTKIFIKILNNSFPPAKVLLFPDIRKFMNYIYRFSLGFSFGLSLTAHSKIHRDGRFWAH